MIAPTATPTTLAVISLDRKLPNMTGLCAAVDAEAGTADAKTAVAAASPATSAACAGAAAAAIKRWTGSAGAPTPAKIRSRSARLRRWLVSLIA
jgi:hypothetical protein